MSTPANALVEKIRGKFPGVYDDISDSDLTKKLLAKYPEYADLAAAPSSKQGAASGLPVAAQTPRLPPGYTLDPPANQPASGTSGLPSGIPPLPPGYTLDPPTDSDDFTRRANAAATAAGASHPGVSPTPLPGAGQRFAGRAWASPLDASENTRMGLEPNAQPLASPILPGQAAKLSAARFFGGLAGSAFSSKLAQHYSDNPWLSDLAGAAGMVFGTGSGALAEDAFSPAKEMIGRAVRTPDGALKPSVSTAARVAGGLAGSPLGTGGTIVGGMAGPSLADAFLPDHPGLPGTGAPLPSADEFYANRGADFMRRGREQSALDRAALRNAAKPDPFRGMTSTADPDLPRGSVSTSPGSAQSAFTSGVPAQIVLKGSAQSAFDPRSAEFDPDMPQGSSGDLISRTRKITIPGEEPTAMDLKRAGDLTQAPLERLKTLAKFGDKLAQNELNRRLKN
jgi:hypothetical protein